jgi:hypothetical protein
VFWSESDAGRKEANLKEDRSVPERVVVSEFVWRYCAVRRPFLSLILPERGGGTSEGKITCPTRSSFLNVCVHERKPWSSSFISWSFGTKV